jgi:hypothetical protein
MQACPGSAATLHLVDCPIYPVFLKKIDCQRKKGIKRVEPNRDKKCFTQLEIDTQPPAPQSRYFEFFS